MKDYPWPVAATLLRSTVARVRRLWALYEDAPRRALRIRPSACSDLPERRSIRPAARFFNAEDDLRTMSHKWRDAIGLNNDASGSTEEPNDRWQLAVCGLWTYRSIEALLQSLVAYRPVGYPGS